MPQPEDRVANLCCGHVTCQNLVKDEIRKVVEHANAHYIQLLDAAVKGRCGYSGLTLRECQSSICDCFDLPRVDPD